MDTKILTGVVFAKMIQNGAAKLYENRKTVNDLNVFPIPDGDTGDNMYMTVNGGSEALINGISDSLSETASKAAKGMFMGARGNSGVILSRIFAGISKGLSGLDSADLNAFAKAMDAGVTEAYNSVSHPVEGTILTVFKDGVRTANRGITSSSTFETYFKDFLTELKLSLERTPDLLDVLKEAGVVDSGGAGFIFIAEGMNEALLGKTIASSETAEDSQTVVDFSAFNEDSELTYGYCTEFMLQLLNSKVGNVSSFDEKEIFDYINSAGDSVVAFRDGSIIKVHVHTKTPGDILNHCQKWGEFLKLKIENMTLQHNETLVDKGYSVPSRKAHKNFATVTVAAGKGIKSIFEELGADYVVEGGQSMNPSVGDFVNAFDSINADNIIVFPNNGNVILTAKQASDGYEKSNIIVIPNHTVGEGYTALANLDTSSGDPEQIISSIMETVESTVTGMVSKANRNTVQNGIEIKDGDYIGFDSHDTIYSDFTDRFGCIEDLADKLNAGDYDVMIVLSGLDVSDEETEKLKKELEKKYRMTEVISLKGMQPIYDFILILE